MNWQPYILFKQCLLWLQTHIRLTKTICFILLFPLVFECVWIFLNITYVSNMWIYFISVLIYPEYHSYSILSFYQSISNILTCVPWIRYRFVVDSIVALNPRWTNAISNVLGRNSFDPNQLKVSLYQCSF